MTPKRRVGCIESSSESESEQSNYGSYIPSEMLSEVPSEVIIQSRIKYGSKRQMLEAFLMEYSGKTSLHGIRYIFQRRRPMCERVMWLIIFVVSFVLSCLVIHKVHMKWQESPVIVGFDEALVPIHKIPFPTITICPEARMETNIFDFRKVYKQFSASNNSAEDLSLDELERLAAALHVCDLDLAKAVVDDLPIDLDPDIVKTLRGVAVTKNETAPFCKWNNRYYFCENIFTFVATDDGICYQFNGLSPADFYRNESYAPEVPDDIKIDFNNYPDRVPNATLVEFTGSWSMEEGYINQTQHSYPQRLVSASATNALTVLLQGLEHNFDYKCRGLRQGYKVFLNSPGNVVISSSNYMLAGHKRDIMMQIYPVYTTTSNAVREFTPERLDIDVVSKRCNNGKVDMSCTHLPIPCDIVASRQCFFNSERYLRFFKQYSESNCQFECLTNYTISKCGCVKFTMPKPEDVRVCNHTEITCYNDAEDDLMMIQQNEILQKLKDPQFQSECNCLPGCVSLNYNFDISQARMDGSGTIQASNDTYDEHPDFMWTLLTVHFKDQQFTAIKRSELYTVSTLIANYGGVLSLFIGFSILSIVELVYFVTIRLKYSLKVRDIREDDSD